MLERNITMGTGAGISDVVFDFCGVLVDRRVERTLAGFYPDNQIREYFAYDDRSGYHFFESLLDLGVGIDEACRLCATERGAKSAAMLRCSHDHAELAFTRLVPGIEQLLTDLSAAGVRLWGLTNMPSDTFKKVRDRFPQIFDLLSDVLVSGDERIAKPDAEIFRLAARRFGIDAADTLFVDDNSINVEVAERVGMRGAAFIDEPRLRQRMRDQGVGIPPEHEPAHAGSPAMPSRGALPGEEGRQRSKAGRCILNQKEETMFIEHDGASDCTTAKRMDHEYDLTPDNGRCRGTWRAVTLGDLSVPHPDADFWAERCREYRALQWNRMDWAFIREQLERIAVQLQGVSCSQPEISVIGGTERERSFLEMWFGYGDPRCAARVRGGRLEVTSGRHRVLAVSNQPLDEEDARYLGLDGNAFAPGDPLPKSALLPIFVQE